MATQASIEEKKAEIYAAVRRITEQKPEAHAPEEPCTPPVVRVVTEEDVSEARTAWAYAKNKLDDERIALKELQVCAACASRSECCRSRWLRVFVSIRM